MKAKTLGPRRVGERDKGEKVKVICPVVVMSTKRQIRIFKTLVESAQSASFMVSGDGTHRNDCGNGKIVNLGLVCTVLDTVKKNRKITRKCRNIIHVK